MEPYDLPPPRPDAAPIPPAPEYVGGGREKPLCVALIVCDQVVEDRRTGNKTLVGLFDGILAPQLPAIHPRLFLMATLTSGTGAWPWALRITGPGGGEVMRFGDTLRFVDPLVAHDLVVEVRNLPLESPGVYFVDLLLAEVPITNRRFTVRLGGDAGVIDVPRFGGGPPPPPPI